MRLTSVECGIFPGMIINIYSVSLQRVGLCNAIDIWKCHTCKIDEFHYPAETASFDLKLNQLQHEFEGELAVTLHYRPQINCVNTKTTKRETIVVKKGVSLLGTNRDFHKRIECHFQPEFTFQA